jgi:hypothetical protein
LVVPPGLFLALCVIVLVGADKTGTRVFFAFMTLATGYWFLRCWRAAVEVDESGVVLRGQSRTRRLQWTEIEQAIMLRMRSASPLSARFPYVCLGVRLTNGEVRRFDDLAAPAARLARVEAAIQAINTGQPGRT